MLLGQFKICLLSENQFKNMEIHSFLGPFPRFPVHFLENVKNAEFQLCFGASNLNEEQKNFPRCLLIHRHVELSQNVNWKAMTTISLTIRNPGFEFSLNLVFRMVIIA